MLSDFPLEESHVRKLFNTEINKTDLRGLVGSSNLHNTISVYLKCNLNLRDTPRRRRNASKFELSEMVVVLGQRTFTLEDLDQDSGLVVSSSGEASADVNSMFIKMKGNHTSDSSLWG